MVGGMATAWSLAARAQRGERRVGVLIGFAEDDPRTRERLQGLVRGLQDLGWINESNLRMAVRYTAGNIEKTRSFAKELVELQPDVIITGTTPATDEVARHTRTIPTIFVIVSDPVGSGFVASLARPGGNITGFANVEGSLGGKWLELLKEIAPNVNRVALIFNPETAPYSETYLRPFQAAASALAVEPIKAPVRSVAEVEQVFAKLTQSPDAGLVVMTDSWMFVHRAEINSLAARLQVPAVSGFPNRDGLISHAVDGVDQFRRAASYVDRIFRGEKPADLPVQLPTKFELTVNLKIAKALGIEVPPSLLSRADEVIE